MKRIFQKLKIVLLISLFSLFCFTAMTYAVSNSSSVKFGRTTYSPAMSTGVAAPPVGCNVNSSSDGTNLLISFVSGKRAGKTAFVNLNFNLSTDEYNNLMAGDTIDFQQSTDFTSLIGQKVFFIFSEGSARKSRTKAVSISEGPPAGADSSYSVMGTVKILAKRDDGCLDVNFNAVAQNASVNKVTTTINPSRDCIEGTMSETLRKVPSLEISGNLFPEKFSGSSTSTSGSMSMLCNAPSIPGSSGGIGTSSGSTGIPGFSSSGFTIPGFGSSSGFTIPGFGSSGFTIPGLPGDDSETP